MNPYSLESGLTMKLLEGCSFCVCPNTGLIMLALRGDDKVLCNCGEGETNIIRGGMCTHNVKECKQVPVTDWLKQEAARLHTEFPQ